MKKKLTLAVFIVLFLALLAFYIAHKIFYHPEQEKTSATVVLPQLNSEDGRTSADSSLLAEENTLVSLVPLESDETLLSIVSMDFDGDGYDDQVNSIKTVNSPYISLLVGLYNPALSSYERKAVIATEVTQVRTFSYTGMDLTGDHRTALIYQGFAENGDSILQAFFITRVAGRFSLKKIAEFRSDGTIFVQQLDRYDAYDRSHAKGDSFPIWVYSSDTTRPNSVDQLQTRYDWNADEGKYVQGTQIRVAGSRIAAKELSRIQDGTVKTFAKFLNGLWYKTVNQNSERLYLFFDYENSEVIFFNREAEEVYKWIHSNIRRNGIYLSVVNQNVENLQRRINISLINVDQIYVRSQDDLRMPISESNVWDGDYKKVVSEAVFEKNDESLISASQIISELEKAPAWKTSEGNLVKFENGTIVVKTDSSSDSGIYTALDANKSPFIQFRTNSNIAWLKETYLVSFGTSLSSKNSGKNTVVLQPYLVQANGIYPLNKRTVVLTKSTDDE